MEEQAPYKRISSTLRCVNPLSPLKIAAVFREEEYTESALLKPILGEMAATGLGELHSPLWMLEIVEIACSYDVFAFRPHLHTGGSGTCWPSDAERGTLARSTQEGGIAWAGEYLPGADDFK